MRREAVSTRGEEGRDLPDGENRLDVSPLGRAQKRRQQWERRKTPVGVHDLPPAFRGQNRGGGGEHLS